MKIAVNKKYLIIPINLDAEESSLAIYCSGKMVTDISVRLSKNADILTFTNVEKYIGAQIEIVSQADSDLLSLIYLADELPCKEQLYQEKYRPKLHFSTKLGWVNDPNGMVFANGKYHFFYQHNPYDTRWGNMHWGHAVSSDLIHWQETEESLYPDESGTMFSGCAVLDKNNVSGLGTTENPPLLLFYTAAGGTNNASVGVGFTMCIAISLDGGKTFNKYSNNPILATYCPGNRDPKITWHEPSKRFIMAMFLKEYDFAFYSSPDLLHWRYESEDSFPTMNECPDLFMLNGSDKWVLLAGADLWADGSVGKYYIGNFDGKSFKKISGPHKIDLGGNFYSLQTFDNTDDRRILMGWRTRNFFNKPKNGMPFNGEFSLPCVLTACQTQKGLSIARYPVKEFFDVKPLSENLIKNKTFCAGEKIGELNSVSFYLDIDLDFSSSAILQFNLGGNELIYDSAQQELTCLAKVNKVPLENGKLKAVIVCDIESMEVFCQNGKYTISDYYNSHKGLNSFKVLEGSVKVASFKCVNLPDIWKK